MPRKTRKRVRRRKTAGRPLAREDEYRGSADEYRGSADEYRGSADEYRDLRRCFIEALISQRFGAEREAKESALPLWVLRVMLQAFDLYEAFHPNATTADIARAELSEACGSVEGVYALQLWRDLPANTRAHLRRIAGQEEPCFVSVAPGFIEGTSRLGEWENEAPRLIILAGDAVRRVENVA